LLVELAKKLNSFGLQAESFAGALANSKKKKEGVPFFFRPAIL